MRCFTTCFLIVVSAAGQIESVGDVSPAVAPAGVRALLIGGINKDPEEIRTKDRSVIGFAAFLKNNANASEKNLVVLAPKDSFVTERNGDSDAGTIARTLAAFAAEPFAGTTIVYYTGQANLVGEDLRLNIPGPDITDGELAGIIKAFGDAPVCVILDCPGAGHAAKLLAGPKRVSIFAARSDQPITTRFSDYFVPALEDSSADANSDGRISLLEAFQLAVQQIDSMFRDQDLMKTETALLDDNGDGVPSQHPSGDTATEKDGKVAGGIYVDAWEMLYYVKRDSDGASAPEATE